MATYTVDAYINKLRKIKLQAKPFYDVANELIGRIDNRVFNKGIGGDGRSIGSYSNEGAYFSISGRTNTARNLKSKARGFYKGTGPKFKNGKPRKSVFMPGGYSQFKTDVGKNTAGGNVNLWLSGRLRKAWQNSIAPVKMTQSGFGILFTIKTGKQNSEGKMEGIVEKYPTAFNLTKGEKGYILKRFNEEFLKQIIK